MLAATEEELVDPVTLATAVVGLMLPVLKRVGEGVADAAGEAALPAAKRLYTALKERLGAGSYQHSQLKAVEERPDSEGRRQALQTALVELFEENPDVAQELEPLVKAAEAEAGVSFTAQESGAVAGRDVNIQGHFAAGRDQHISGAD
jgi:hypothetical protein